MTEPVDNIWQIIANTPWWIAPLFCYLMYLGYLANKPRTLSYASLLRAPLIFTAFTIVAMFTYLNHTPLNILIWLATLIIGTIMGWLNFKLTKVKAIKDERKLALPGTWMLWIFSIGIFTAKFYYHYDFMLDLETVKQPHFQYALCTLYGFFTGLFIGKIIYARHALKFGPYVNALT